MRDITVRRRAELDLFEAIDHYAAVAPDQLDRFLAAVDGAMRTISRSPGLGSPLFAEQLDVPGLRHQPLRGFPFAAFYLEIGQELVVIRVLHHARDIATLLDTP